MNRLFWSDTPVLAAVADEEELPTEVVARVSEMLRDATAPVLDFAKCFQKYKDVLLLDPEQVTKDLTKQFTQDDEHSSLDYLGLLGAVR
jgi:hypothetical protein